MIWERLRYFSRNEAWGDPDKMNGALLILLDNLRDIIGSPFVIHYGTQGVHSRHSLHYKGNAVDFHIKTSMPYYEQVIALEQALEQLQVSNFVGFGIYPGWNHPGFHLDLRGYKARWGRIGKEYYGIDYVKDAIRKGIVVPGSDYMWNQS